MTEVKSWDALVSQFRNQSLQKSDWTHELHLVVALWHLLEYKDFQSVLCYLRAGIILHNHSIGIKNTESSGYHETITVFWIKQLGKFLQSQESEDFNTLTEKLLKEMPFLQKEYIFQFYDKEVLKSVQARATYIPPAK